MSASVKSSNPTSATRLLAPSSLSARITPKVTRFWLEKMAVGGSSEASSSSAASLADSSS